MAAQTVGTENPTFTPLSVSEGGPANPARPRVTLKHNGRMAAGVPADSQRRMAPPRSLMEFRLFNIHFYKSTLKEWQSSPFKISYLMLAST